MSKKHLRQLYDIFLLYELHLDSYLAHSTFYDPKCWKNKASLPNNTDNQREKPAFITYLSRYNWTWNLLDYKEAFESSQGDVRI